MIAKAIMEVARADASVRSARNNLLNPARGVHVDDEYFNS